MLNLPFRGGGGGGDACLVWRTLGNAQTYSYFPLQCTRVPTCPSKKKRKKRNKPGEMIFLLCVFAHWDIPASMNLHVMWCLRGLTLKHCWVSPFHHVIPVQCSWRVLPGVQARLWQHWDFTRAQRVKAESAVFRVFRGLTVRLVKVFCCHWGCNGIVHLPPRRPKCLVVTLDVKSFQTAGCFSFCKWSFITP